MRPKMSERIHPHPKIWRRTENGSISGEYRTTPRKRGGVNLWFCGIIIFAAENARVAKMFAVRHAAGEVPAITI